MQLVSTYACYEPGTGCNLIDFVILSSDLTTTGVWLTVWKGIPRWNNHKIDTFLRTYTHTYILTHASYTYSHSHAVILYQPGRFCLW